MWAVEQLEVRKKWIELAKNVYILIKNSTEFAKDFWLRDQIQRCAVSIPSNIAEWWSRWTDKEFIRFLCISRWSCSELKTQLIIAKEIWYITEETYNILDEEIKNIHKMINWLINRISR